MPATQGVRTHIEPRSHGSVPRNSHKGTRMADWSPPSTLSFTTVIAARKTGIEPRKNFIWARTRELRQFRHVDPLRAVASEQRRDVANARIRFP